MSESERIAIAARLHVALRRKTGRVTDTEWLALNPDYAAEIVRFARARAAETDDLDLDAIAARLELVMAPLTAAVAVARQSGTAKPGEPLARLVAAAKYVGGLR